MHCQLAVCIRHRTGHLREQAQPRLDVEMVVAAILIDTLALDVLDGEIRLPVCRDARIVQVRDVRMGQCRKNLAFPRHALREPRAPPPAVRQLQRHRPIDQAIGALGQPDHPHAAAAQLAHEPIGPDHVARSIGIGRDLQDVQRVSGELRKGVEVRASLALRGEREQASQARLEGGVLRPKQVHPSATLWCRLIEGRIQELIQLGPRTRVGFDTLHAHRRQRRDYEGVWRVVNVL
jgi:hypothetical protein